VARDDAFGLCYADDLDSLRRHGAELVFFDTLSDPRLAACNGLFIGGGFPEAHAAQLEANATLRADIYAAIAAGLPAYAECGGLMYLSRPIRWNGERREMVASFPPRRACTRSRRGVASSNWSRAVCGAARSRGASSATTSSTPHWEVRRKTRALHST
jgi:cobyrinic acid a,c-diamide synthase